MMSLEPKLVRAQLFEVLAGALLLFLGLTIAFLAVAGRDASLLQFLLLSALLLATCVTVLVFRLHRYSADFMRHLYAQLPFETRCSLTNRRNHCGSAPELVTLLGNHVREQQELLNINFLQNVIEAGHNSNFAIQRMQPALSVSANTLQLLQAELQELERQFKDDSQGDLS